MINNDLAINDRNLRPKRPRYSAFSSDKRTKRSPGLTAGDSGHSGANPRHAQVRNSNAHPMGPLTAAEPAQNSGEPERGGGDNHGQE